MKTFKPPKSHFQFEGFKIIRSVFDRKEGKVSKSLSIGFQPKGKYYQDDGKFELYMEIRIEDNNKRLLIEIDSQADFKLHNTDEKYLRNYLFVNAPALLFPYIRAYIASLTSISGYINAITLPTLNLTNLANDLERNTEFIKTSE